MLVVGCCVIIYNVIAADSRESTCPVITRHSQHSQECKDPLRQCFCDSWVWPLTFWIIYFDWLPVRFAVLGTGTGSKVLVAKRKILYCKESQADAHITRIGPFEVVHISVQVTMQQFNSRFMQITDRLQRIHPRLTQNRHRECDVVSRLDHSSDGGVRGSSDPTMLEAGVKTISVTPIIRNGCGVVLMFLSSIEEQNFLPTTNQNEVFWPNIFTNFPGCYTRTPAAGGGHPFPHSLVPAHACWTPVFSTLRRHWITGAYR